LYGSCNGTIKGVETNRRKRTQKRYNDTDLIISEIIGHGYESERASRAIARMNAPHSHPGVGYESVKGDAAK